MKIQSKAARVLTLWKSLKTSIRKKFIEIYCLITELQEDISG